MAVPMMSLPDPTTEGEGGIDPLGLLPIADRFAAAMVPGVAQRMARPRFLSLMCAQAVVNEDVTMMAGDGTTADLVFEWIVVQAFAQLDDEIRRIPGIGKARAVLRDNAPMTSRAYLKGPKVFGFHGVYKTFGVSLGLFDDELRLMVSGERLAAALERSGPLAGLIAGSDATPGGKWSRRMREMVIEGLKEGGIRCPKGLVYDTIVNALRPDRMTKAEATVLRDLIAQPSGGTRGELFELMDRPEVRVRQRDVHERPFLRSLRPLASPELAAHLDAIEGLEGVAKPIQDAFDWMLFLSSKNRLEPLRAAAFAAQVPDLLPALREGVERLPRMVSASPHAREVDGLLVDFGNVRSMTELFDAVADRHDRAQKRKPPNGKRPWFERTADGGLVVRPMYLRDEQPVAGDYGVHFYRTLTVASFLDDLGDAR
jgi:hypothetical protein